MIIGAYFNQSHGGSACQGRNTFLSDMSEKKKVVISSELKKESHSSMLYSVCPN